MKRKKTFLLALGGLFLILSVLFINPPARRAAAGLPSSALQLIRETDGTMEKQYYADESGAPVFPSDKGYAIRTFTRTPGSRLDEYFDENGQPVRQSAGYAAILREYDEQGREWRTTYLDADGRPVITAHLYAVTERTFYGNGKVETARYFDAEGHPACSRSEAYGKHITYDEKGRESRIIYLDPEGRPMRCGAGFAMKTQTYYETDGADNDKVRDTFYFDENGLPLALSLGEYGQRKEYDEQGRSAKIIYLDAQGNPTVNQKGYAWVLRTFDERGAVVTERYFDQAGNPHRLSEGQYGVKWEDRQTVYLDADGREMFNLRLLLNQDARFAVALALLCTAVSALTGRRANAALLVLSLGMIAYFTLMYRETGAAGRSLPPLRMVTLFFTDAETRSDLLRNVWLFVPFGAALGRLCPRRAALALPFALSALVEATQYITGLGIFELDDILCNGLGGLIGFGTGRAIWVLCRKKTQKERLQ